MRANPLVNQYDESWGLPTGLPSNFKADLINNLSKKKKALFMKFDILTRERLFDCLQYGSRILHLNCEEVDDESLLVENGLAKQEKISFAEIKEAFQTKPMTSNLGAIKVGA